MDAIFIHGTSFNVSEVFIDEDEPSQVYLAKVSKFNKFGYFELTIANCDKKLKRHLADCYDVQSMCLGGWVMGLIMLGPEHFALHVKGESEDVYVIRSNNRFIARTRKEDRFTDDITLAWFTFDKEQAERFAMHLTMKELTVYEAISVEDIIQLDKYVED